MEDKLSPTYLTLARFFNNIVLMAGLPWELSYAYHLLGGEKICEGEKVGYSRKGWD